MLGFRPLNDSDIPLVEEWLNKEHVKRWYEIPDLNITIDDWVSEIREYNGKFKWITYLIVLHENQPIGVCLYYKCEDSVDEDFGSLPLQDSYAIDYFIGDESKLRKGLGKEMVSLLVRRLFAFKDVKRITADIDKNNSASGKTLSACNFILLDGSPNRYVITKQVYQIDT